MADEDGKIRYYQNFGSSRQPLALAPGVWFEGAAVHNHRKYLLEGTSGGHTVSSPAKSKKSMIYCVNQNLVSQISTSLRLEVPQWNFLFFPCSNLSLLPFIVLLHTSSSGHACLSLHVLQTQYSQVSPVPQLS